MRIDDDRRAGMDMAAWLWERVERRDAPAVLAHALSHAPTRDALLRQAAVTGQWDQLEAAATQAADIARHVGWSRSSPDVVSAICRWISADKALRRIPPSDRAAPLAAAALAAWAAPGELAGRLAASDPLSTSASAAFEDALGQEAAWLQSLDDLEARLGDGADAAGDVLDDDQGRSLLVRHAARTGEWEDLHSVAEEARQNADVEGAGSDRAEQVAQLSSWMLGQGDHPAEDARTRAQIADSLASGGHSRNEALDAVTAQNEGPGLTTTPAGPTAHPAPNPVARR